MTRFTKHTDDILLWNHFRSGDEEAYTELARRHYRMLLHYGQRFTPNQQIIEDALQDVLVNLWLRRAFIQDTPSVKFYLLKSFRHRILKNIKPFSEEVELTDRCEHLHAEFSQEDLLIQGETDLALKKQVRSAMKRLPARQQEVIYLRFFQNLKPEEIASVLSIHPQSVSNTIQRALQRLRELWISVPSASTLSYLFSQILF